MRMRVETREGVLVVYDAAAPPEADEGCSGYMGYWLSARDKTQYVFGATLYDQSDLTTTLLALERDLGVDLEALAASDDRVDGALRASAEAPSEEIVWEPATLHRAVEIMGFEAEEELTRVDEPDDGGVATHQLSCQPCMAASLGPPMNCGSPEGLAREALSVVADCCGGGGGGGGCTGPCCGSTDPCCGSSNPCCGVGPAHGAIHAKVTATGLKDCDTWADACTLSSAIAAANAGDEVWVAAGTYRPAGAGGDRAATFQLKNGVAIYGGRFGGHHTYFIDGR